jgi:hypothetical protein
MNQGEGPQKLYLDLLKRCLINWIYGDAETQAVTPQVFWKRKLVEILQNQGLKVVRPAPMDPKLRSDGLDWPAIGHTMIGLKRLDNLQFCVEDVLANNIPGDFIEAGVWRGGATIFMRAILEAYGIENRIVWVADSFEGCPKPNAEKYPQDVDSHLYTRKILAVSIDEVKANFQRYGLLDSQVRFLAGWFKDTLPQAPIKELAVIRLDGDLYESTMDALINLYPRLSKGGYLIVDDFGAVPGCKQAVEDFRKKYDIKEKIMEIDWTGIYWRRCP